MQRAETADGVDGAPESVIEALSAVTLATADMRRAVRFYRALGFRVTYGGEGAPFTTFRAGAGYLNLIREPEAARRPWWGRVIFHVRDVDDTYARALAEGLEPATMPRDAEWGERYFQIFDPDGHDLSFAKPLS